MKKGKINSGSNTWQGTAKYTIVHPIERECTVKNLLLTNEIYNLKAYRAIVSPTQSGRRVSAWQRRERVRQD